VITGGVFLFYAVKKNKISFDFNNKMSHAILLENVLIFRIK